MLKLNLLKLFANINNVKSDEETRDVQITDYLNGLLTKLLSDNPICLSDVDFNAFTMEELEDVETYIRRLDMMIEKSHKIRQNIVSAKTQALSIPTFC